MEKRKKELKEIIKSHRFSSIKDELLDYLREYEELCRRDKDEDGLSCAYFYHGEVCFRLGKSDECISYLNRSLLYPKRKENVSLEASAYNILGLMFTSLGNEVVALENYLQSLDTAEDNGLYNQKAITYINIGWLYRDLGDYTNSMSCYDLALRELNRSDSSNYYNIEVLCHAYRGQIYCKLEQFDKAIECGQTIQQLKEKNHILFYEVSVENLFVRLYDYLGEKEKMYKNITALIEKCDKGEDFLEFCEFYIDVCRYILSKEMRNEARRMLESLHKNIDKTDLIYIKLRVQSLEVLYHNKYSRYEGYLNACRAYMVMQEKYESYIKKAKLISLQNIQNLRQIRKEKEKYEEISRRDKMTGLLNKVTLEEMVQMQLENMQNTNQSVALILIDLDHFKTINDTLGHLTGDKMIRDVAQKIKDLFPYSKIVGRVGGDEFVVFTKSYSKKDSIERADGLRKELNKLCYHNKFVVTASIGIAFWEQTIREYEELFSIADKALYKAKSAGRNRIVVGN